MRGGVVKRRVVAGFDQHVGKANAEKRRFGQERDRAPVGLHGLGNTAVLEQDLPLEFVKVGVLRPFGDQRVDQVQRARQFGQVPIIGDRPGVARHEALVCLRITGQGALGRFEKSPQLGLHASEFLHYPRRRRRR